MHRPALFRAIYAELRNSLGADVTSGELVSIANHILRAYSDDVQVVQHGEPRPSRSLVSLPVDEAMQDGGWKVLEFEIIGRDLDELNPQLPIAARLIVDKYLGPEWKTRMQREQ